MPTTGHDRTGRELELMKWTKGLWSGIKGRLRVNSKGECSELYQMWCVVELVINLCTRLEVLGSNITLEVLGSNITHSMSGL
jgi:hypothetical protein